MLFERLDKAPAGVFIDGGVLEELLSNNGLFLRQAEGTNLTSTWMRCPGYVICS